MSSPGLEAALLWYAGFMLLYLFGINTYYLVLTIAGFWRTLRTVHELQRPDQ